MFAKEPCLALAMVTSTRGYTGTLILAGGALTLRRICRIVKGSRLSHHITPTKMNDFQIYHYNSEGRVITFNQVPFKWLAVYC